MKTINSLRNTIIGTSLLVIGLVIGIGVTTHFPLLANSFFTRIKSTPRAIKVVDEAEVKKQALAKFYNQIITAEDGQDWSSLYELLPQSFRDSISKDKYIASEVGLITVKYLTDGQMGTIPENKMDTKLFQLIVKTNTVVNGIVVSGNNGTVDRTKVYCSTEECAGKDRTENNAKKQYEYVNGKWQIPDPQPSERALKAANYAYEDSAKKDQNELLKDYGYGSDRSSFAVRNWAVYLDQNLEELIRVETLIEKSKAERSRPIYNQQPAQIIQQQAPAVQQQTFPKNCTSSTVGNYTYTNCY